ncbi:hypothetical protein N9S81_00010 [bacterium]|nr:hypothetical protein [bacterium]
MLKEWFCQGSCLRRVWAWVGLVIFVGHAVFKATLKMRLNGFYERFYDSLQDAAEWPSGEVEEEDHLFRKREEVTQHLIDFSLIVAPAVFVHPFAKFVSSNWVLHWRLALIDSYLDAYNVNKPAIEGASQRVHEDTLKFVSGLYTCFAVFFDSVLTLIVFIPVLLDLGKKVRLPGWEWDPWLFFVAFASAFGGLLISIIVGYKLVKLEVTNQVVEAALRKRLVLLEADPASVVGVQQGSDDVIEDLHFENYKERRVPQSISPLPKFSDILRDVRANYGALYRAFAAFNAWVSLFDQSLIVLPYILVAPLMFAEENRISLGTLTKTTNVFAYVFGAMAVLGDNWGLVNEWRSTLVRLRQFESTIYPPPPSRRQRDQHVSVALVEVSSVVELEGEL